MTSGGGHVKLHGVSYESLALSTAVPYPLPLVWFGRESRGFDYWWRLLYYTFELPSPYDFPPPPDLERTAALDRYCDATRDLASSDCLAYESQVSVGVHRDAEGHQVETVSFDFPPSELVRGFLALFRQFYSDNELASFSKVRDALTTRSKRASDAAADRRLAILKEWGKAHSRLLVYNLKELVGHRLVDEGRFSAEGTPDCGNPSELISAFAYGEHLHWGDMREVVSQWEADQFYGPWNKIRFLEITAGLAYFYMGYAVIVARSVGRSDEFVQAT